MPMRPATHWQLATLQHTQHGSTRAQVATVLDLVEGDTGEFRSGLHASCISAIS